MHHRDVQAFIGMALSQIEADPRAANMTTDARQQLAEAVVAKLIDGFRRPSPGLIRFELDQHLSRL